MLATMGEVAPLAVVSKSSPVVVVGANDDHYRQSTIDLSSFDRCFAPFPVTLLLVFDRPIKDPVESIKKAVSQALGVGHYHPMAGRLTADGCGIACTGEGVSFVGASASCALDDYFLLKAASMADLAVGYPADLCRPVVDPLVLMQVTEFSCGGFVVGVTWNHVMADGAGMAQFLRAVGEFARGVSSAPSVVPVRSSSLLPCLPPSTVAARRAMMGASASKEMASLDITIPWSLIARVRAEWKHGHGDEEQPCTVFEAVTAMLWRSRTRAITTCTEDAYDDDELPAPVAFLSNVRRLVGAEDGYYGNCLAVQAVQATSGAVASSGIGDLVKLIKQAKERIPADLFKDGAGDHELQPAVSSAGVTRWYKTLVVTSWRNLGLEAAEMGGGRPARVMWQAEQTVAPGCVVCPPGKGKGNGVNVMALCVRAEHAGAFLAALQAS